MNDEGTKLPTHPRRTVRRWSWIAAGALLASGAGIIQAGPRAARTATPSDPGAGGYVLDWEDEQGHLPPGKPPAGWNPQFVPGRVRIAAIGDGEPVRGGRYSARFELLKDDQFKRHARSELAATPPEPVPQPGQTGTERWYGFSIYLPAAPETDRWKPDQASDIVTQWHQADADPRGGSPPLAILTGKDLKDPAGPRGCWYISQRNWNVANDTISTRIGPYEPELGRWTDWVVHVKWSAMENDPEAFVKIWKNGAEVFDWRKGTDLFEKTGRRNSSIGYGNYMKIGIYKWPWSQGKPSDTDRRVMYHDELRIADQRGSYEAVAPKGDRAPR
jgi:hypothetical protein